MGGTRLFGAGIPGGICVQLIENQIVAEAAATRGVCGRFRWTNVPFGDVLSAFGMARCRRVKRNFQSWEPALKERPAYL